MGTYKELEKQVANQEPKNKVVKSCMVGLWTFLVSMAGGIILGFWEHEYHRTNRQLWMVPFGLILFVTPVVVWFAVFVSENCNSKEDIENSTRRSQP